MISFVFQDRLLGKAIACFELAIKSNPCNKVTLRNVADCYSSIGNDARAVDYYARAVEGMGKGIHSMTLGLTAYAADSKDTNSLFKYAMFLDKTDAIDEAEEVRSYRLQMPHECS